MTDKPTPTDAELEALLLDKLPASKHYIRPVIEKMVAAMQAAIDKWGQPAARQGVAYAALPDERAAFEAWYIAQVRSKTSTTNDWSDDEIRGAWLSRPSEEYRSSFAGQSWEAWQARASHDASTSRGDAARWPGVKGETP